MVQRNHCPKQYIGETKPYSRSMFHSENTAI